MRNEEPKAKRHGDLQSFLRDLQQRRLLLVVEEPVSLVHELTALHQKVLSEGGPALLIKNPVNADGRCSPIPVVANLFGTRQRIELGFGVGEAGLTGLANDLAELQRPTPPVSLADAWSKLPMLKAVGSMRPRLRRAAASQEVVYKGPQIDLGQLPVQ